MKIGRKQIGGTNPCYVIAEVAQAHDGSLGLAHSFIDAAAAAEVDAIKFQTHFAAAESSIYEPWRVKFSKQDESRFDYWKRMEFTREQWVELAEHARSKKLEFLSSPFSVEAVDLLEELQVAAYKIGSGEITNPILLKRIGETKKPVLISTGMSSWKEIDVAMETCQTLKLPVALFQCTTIYPTPLEKVGLNCLRELKDRYRVPVGLSDHSGEVEAGLAAVSLGANLLEVHITFSKGMFGPDATSSITTEDLKKLMKSIRRIETMLSHPVNKDAMAVELNETKKNFSKSLVLTKAMQKGDKLTESCVSSRKPLRGIPSSDLHKVEGVRLLRDLPSGHFLNWDDLNMEER